MDAEPTRVETVLVSWVMALFGRPVYRPFVDSLDLKGDEAVLDFGSGWAENSLLIAEKLNKGGRITCLDVSEEWLKVAKHRLRRFSGTNFVLGDISEANLRDASFDLVIVHLVLHHVDASIRERTVKELVRVLRTGGRLVIREFMISDHGIALDEVRKLMSGAGLTEQSWSRHRRILLQDTYQVTWTKGPPLSGHTLP